MSEARPALPLQFDSERLVLRCPRGGDGDLLHASVMETLADLRRHPASSPWAMQEQSVEFSEQRCVAAAQAFLAREAFPFLVFDKRDGQHVGNVGLHSLDWTVPHAHIGYWCRSSRQGQGFITEAVQAVCEFGFSCLKLRRVQLMAEEGNPASWRVAERAGFMLEGCLRHQVLQADGQPGAARVYGLIR
ncbi:GNAT family N-acetyltransferase [Roseateles aquae]|uniref:GNAT family N-acetyltransferase n=1 Tax=Roseateles aquae TaxID=3077235 RepID=UPI0028E2FDEE|nr:GNAT family protein [Paucibacter sp. APW11]